MRTILASLCLLLCVGCSSIQADLAKLDSFKPQDWERAIEINKAAGDKAGLQCAEGVLRIIKERQGSGDLPKPIGVVSGVAYARAVRIKLEDRDATLEEINLACAAAFNDSVETYAKLLIRFGLAP